MIESKAVIIAVYGIFLLVALSLPFASFARRSFHISDNWFNFFFVLLASSIYIFLVMNTGRAIGITTPLILSLVFVLPVLGSKLWTVTGALVALPFIASTVWWDEDLKLDLSRAFLFLTIGLLAAVLPRLFREKNGVPEIACLIVLVGLAILANGAAAPLSTPVGFNTFWHHWSVYVAPAQSLWAGGVPFADFPIQYGFGPMVLMAAGCFSDCWAGAYVIVALSNITFMLTMVWSSILILRQVPRGLAFCGLAALVASLLVWTAFPPNLLGVLATPSTGGLRFLPLSSMILFIVLTETGATRQNWPGHILWICGLVWSPEAAFFVTLVWWPYLGLRDLHDKSNDRVGPIISIVLKWAIKAVCALLLAIVGLTILFRLSFAEWPSFEGFLIYIKNPPGLLPVNTHGPVWILLIVFLVATIGIARSSLSASRIAAVCLLGMTAVATYYLGRSHDNNVLNLLPFVTLVLIATLNIELPLALTGFVRLMLVGIIAWPATFGLKEWSTAWQKGQADNFGMFEILANLDIASPASWPMLDAAMPGSALETPPAFAVGKAFGELVQTGDGVPLWINSAMLLPRTRNAPVWTGVNNAASYALLPHGDIVTFIRRGAARFKRPGWLLVDRSQPGPWLDLFLTAYSISEKRVFEGYDAYRMVPK
ncbi:hypothetical protein DXM27_23950 [Rhizobium rhizogenes]|uniref:Uncharacterized protein n=1 Tax=Rhizobium rhizogenes TaxID=359 RepID=A0AA88EW61_RHIRH|nr:hypothetical protein [Rhizobium rhizogenes]KAA3498032.1 hypothetical protein DXM27_23950 [Rhizobium rhizogenes]